MASYRKTYPTRKLYDDGGNCYQIRQILDPNLRDNADKMIGTTFYLINGEVRATEDFVTKLTRGEAEVKLTHFAFANAPAGTYQLFTQKQEQGL